MNKDSWDFLVQQRKHLVRFFQDSDESISRVYWLIHLSESFISCWVKIEYWVKKEANWKYWKIWARKHSHKVIALEAVFALKFFKVTLKGNHLCVFPCGTRMNCGIDTGWSINVYKMCIKGSGFFMNMCKR